MARSSGLSRSSRPTWPLRDISDDDDGDNEFPDIAVFAQRELGGLRETGKPGKGQDIGECSKDADKSPKPPASVRRRKLVPIANNNALLRAWTPDSPSEKEGKPRRRKESRAPRVELRTKSTITAINVQLSSTKTNIEQEDVAEEEEVTIIEEVSIMGDNDDDDDSDDVFQSAESNASSLEDEDDSDDSLTEFFARSARPKKQQSQAKGDLDIRPTNHDRDRTARKGRPREKAAALNDIEESLQANFGGESQDKGKVKPGVSSGRDLADTFSRLNL